MAQQLLSHAWIFVSHSNQDITKVRRVRNRLERLGAQPLLFFLKATLATPELRGLLNREIEARNFFLYCRSSHAEQSTWVQKEVAHVRSLLPGKIFVEIDLESGWPHQRTKLDALYRASTVFLSYSRNDRRKVHWFEQLLVQNEFTVFRENDLDTGAEWNHRISKELAAIAQAGHFILFLSAAALESSWVGAELLGALTRGREPSRKIVVKLEQNIRIDELTKGLEFECLDYDENTARQGLQLLRLLGLDKPSITEPDMREQT